VTTQRIAPLSVDDSIAAAGQVGVAEFKAHANLYRVLLHHPQIAQRVNDLIDTLMTESGLDTRLRELIVMRIGWVNSGVYEWTQHWRIAHGFGVDERELLATRDWPSHDDWSPADCAALQATDETIAHGVISSATWSTCADAFPTERERIELVATIGAWKMMSEILQSLDVPLEDGIDPWPPDGLAPTHERRETP